jgi:hypothetical protein
MFFSIGAQKAHYKVRINDLEGNMNVLISKWRHSFLADFFTFIGLLLFLYSCAGFLGQLEVTCRSNGTPDHPATHHARAVAVTQ